MGMAVIPDNTHHTPGTSSMAVIPVNTHHTSGTSSMAVIPDNTHHTSGTSSSDGIPLTTLDNTGSASSIGSQLTSTDDIGMSMPLDKYVDHLWDSLTEPDSETAVAVLQETSHDNDAVARNEPVQKGKRKIYPK